MPMWNLQTANQYQPRKTISENFLEGLKTGETIQDMALRRRQEKNNYLAKMQQMKLDEEERQRVQGRFEDTHGLNTRKQDELEAQNAISNKYEGRRVGALEKGAETAEAREKNERRRLNLDEQKYHDEQEKAAFSRVWLPEEKPQYTDEERRRFVQSLQAQSLVYSQRIKTLGKKAAKELVTAVETAQKLADPATPPEEVDKYIETFRGYQRELIGPEKMADLAIKEKQLAGKVSDDEKFEATQQQRMRNVVAKAWGYSEFSSLDEETANKVLEASEKAAEYMEGDLTLDKAALKAYKETRLKYAVKDLPQAQGGWGATKNAAVKLKELLDMGLPREEARGVLRGKGWEEEDIQEIMESLGTNPTAPSGNQDVSQMTDEQIMQQLGF